MSNSPFKIKNSSLSSLSTSEELAQRLSQFDDKKGI